MKKIILIFVLLILIFTVSACSESSDSTNNIDKEVNKEKVSVESKEESNTQKQEEKVTPKTPKGKIEYAITEYVDKEKIKKIELNDYQGKPDKKILLVYFKGSDNLTKGYIRDGMYIDCAYIFREVYDTDIPIQEVVCFVSFPLTDQYGNESEENVMKIVLTKETEQKINWENFIIQDIYKVADEVWLHPALRE